MVAKAKRRARRPKIDASTRDGAVELAQWLSVARGRWFVNLAPRIVANPEAKRMVRNHLAQLVERWAATDVAVKNLRHACRRGNVAA